MDKKKYEKLCNDWDSWINRRAEYLNKRISLIRLYKDNEDLQERVIEDLEAEYNANNLNEVFGPWTTIYDKEDLLDRNFILPGLGHCFLDSPGRDTKAILDSFGKKCWNCLDEYVGIVVGYGYDSGDDYLLTEREEGGKKIPSSVLINERYTLGEKEEGN